MNEIIELTKKNNLRELRKYIHTNNIQLDIINNKKIYNILLIHFTNTDTLTEISMNDYTELFKFFTKNLEKSDLKKLIYKINDKLDNYMDNKTVYSLLKSLYVYCNKSLHKERTNIDSILALFGSTDNIKHILFYIHKLQNYIENKSNDIDYNKIVRYLERIIYEKDIINPVLLYFINKCKKNGNIYMNDLDKILAKCDENLHNYVYFLNNKKTAFIDEELVCKFIENLGYKKKMFTVIDNLNLKRGFIFCLSKDNVDYVLKYQPNKSVMELILNCYMKKLNSSGLTSSKINIISSEQNQPELISNPSIPLKNNVNMNSSIPLKNNVNMNVNMNSSMELKNNVNMNVNMNSSMELKNNVNMNLDFFLLPSSFYVNHDCSYFYIIKKYNTDLYKYFNILESKNKILPFSKMLEISHFLLKGLIVLKENNIIHGDLKLENIVLNYNDEHDITDLKIIDFDVGVFNKIPKSLLNISEKYDKVMENKKIRGTKLYMLKNNAMCFDNDLYSFGVLMLILLYKNMKLIFSTFKNNINDKKMIIKHENYIKRLNQLRNVLEVDENKIKMLKLILDFITENSSHPDINQKNNFLNDSNNIKNEEKTKIENYIEMILDCLKLKISIEELHNKYKNILFHSI